MPEAAVVNTTTTTADATTTTTTATADTTQSLGWRAGLPDDLKTNADLTTYKTVGDFTKDALSWKGKTSELEAKLADAIPKLPEDATDADRNLYYEALGRPKSASEYELDGEDKNAPEWTNLWKQEFHGLGLTKAQAKDLSTKWNSQMQSMVKAHNDALTKERTESEAKLRSELGDKYDTNVELAKRMWTKYGEGEFDKAFASESSGNRFAITRLLLKLAALTGEDTSPTSGQSVSKGAAKLAFTYDKSPPPPVKR